jgi:hypothetical protein
LPVPAVPGQSLRAALASKRIVFSSAPAMTWPLDVARSAVLGKGTDEKKAFHLESHPNFLGLGGKAF